MIALIAAALLAGPSMTLAVSDLQAQHLSDACVAAAVHDLGEAPPVSTTLQSMVVKREARAWRIDYDVTLKDRFGRASQWNGRCTVAAPHVELVASN